MTLITLINFGSLSLSDDFHVEKVVSVVFLRHTLLMTVASTTRKS